MKFSLVPLLACALLFVGCASTGPAGGALFHDIKYGVTATPNAAALKKGQACQNSILGLFSFGDASIDTAKKASGITKVASVDASSWSLLFLYNEYCTIIKGE